jgi:hypothetical protein
MLQFQLENYLQQSLSGLISFFFSFSIMILSFFTFYQNWIMPNMIDLILLSMIGILGGLANLWLSQSYKLSEVSLVSPLKVFSFNFCNNFWLYNLGRNTYFKNPNRSFAGNFFFIYNI